MSFLMEKIEWFEIIVERLSDCSDRSIWSPSGDEILCKTENVANVLADILEQLYKAHGESVIINTGFYDPEEDKRNGEEDCRTGWWYVTIG